MSEMCDNDCRLPFTYRVAEAARWALRGPGTRMVYRSLLAPALRRALFAAAPPSPTLVSVCGGQLRGFRLWVDLTCEKYYWLGVYEEHVQALAATSVEAGAVVYDIGAHIGFFTVLFSRLSGQAGIVYAFEPLPQNIERLMANVEVNSLANVRARCIAVSDQEGSGTLVARGSSLMAHLTENNGEAAEGVIPVQTTTVDAMVSGGYRIPSLLKIDVEGAEGRVIRGAARTLQSYRPWIVLEIHSAQSAEEVIAALPVPYLIREIATGRKVNPPLEAGHYLLRPQDA
jgi:FkbM family methyltransferase